MIIRDKHKGREYFVCSIKLLHNDVLIFSDRIICPNQKYLSLIDEIKINKNALSDYKNFQKIEVWYSKGRLGDINDLKVYSSHFKLPNTVLEIIKKNIDIIENFKLYIRVGINYYLSETTAPVGNEDIKNLIEDSGFFVSNIKGLKLCT